MVQDTLETRETLVRIQPFRVVVYGSVAQWSEQGTHNTQVLGSNPS